MKWAVGRRFSRGSGCLGTMRPRHSASGSRSGLQEGEPAHVVAQVTQAGPGGGTLLPDAPHPRPFHLVDHATEHMFDAHADPGTQPIGTIRPRVSTGGSCSRL